MFNMDVIINITNTSNEREQVVIFFDGVCWLCMWLEYSFTNL